MKIKVLTKFIDGTNTFEKDDIRTVSNEKGAYFVSLGWALSEDGTLNEPFEGEINLAIKNGSIDLNADNQLTIG